MEASASEPRGPSDFANADTDGPASGGRGESLSPAASVPTSSSSKRANGSAPLSSKAASGKNTTPTSSAAPGSSSFSFPHLAEAARASRFGFVRSNVFYALSWQNPQVSAVIFVASLSMFLAHSGLQYSLIAVALHVAFLAVLGSGLIHLYNTFQPASALPQIRADINSGSVYNVFTAAGDRINAAVQRANVILSWARPAESARALAYSWLAASFSYLLTPGYFFTAFLLAFILAPAYLHFQRDIDSAIDTHILPHVQQLSIKLSGVESQVAAVYHANTVPLQVALVAVALLFFYAFWNVISISGLATFASLIVAVRDLIKRSTQSGDHRRE